MSILFNFTDSQLFNSNIEIISSLFFANINRENALLCRADCLNMKILQLNNNRSGGQRFGFKIPHLP